MTRGPEREGGLDGGQIGGQTIVPDDPRQIRNL